MMSHHHQQQQQHNNVGNYPTAARRSASHGAQPLGAPPPGVWSTATNQRRSGGGASSTSGVGPVPGAGPSSVIVAPYQRANSAIVGGGHHHSNGNGNSNNYPVMANGYHAQSLARGGGGRASDAEGAAPPPTYAVEHLATFAVGRQWGLLGAADGVRKLRQMERAQALWAQPMTLKLRRHVVAVEDDNGDVVEEWSIGLIEQPAAHISSDPRDTFNNLLLFIVRADPRNKPAAHNPTEMHIFQCVRISASDVAEDMRSFLAGNWRAVRGGRRQQQQQQQQPPLPQQQYPGDGNYIYGPPVAQHQGGSDAASVSSDSSERFERDVNTLNRCFDDIERFVARIQAAALAQREVEAAAAASKSRGRVAHGMLHRRAQLPAEADFVDIFRKFKLSFNLLARLKAHIHEPNAPELLHFLFTPLAVILEACHWGLGRNVAPQVIAPLLTLEARELLQNCLSSREHDVWMSLGEAWRTPPEDWPGPLPIPYRPVFSTDPGMAFYQPPPPNAYNAASMARPVRRGASAPPPQQYGQSPGSIYGAPLPATNGNRDRSADGHLSSDFDRLSMERERLEWERARLLQQEQRLATDQQRVAEEKRRLAAEREMLAREQTEATTNTMLHPTNASRTQSLSQLPQQQQQQAPFVDVAPLVLDQDTSPRTRAFVEDVLARGGKLVRTTYDRVAQNTKELTISKDEYLEVLNDSRNWWECVNVHQRHGYVPRTILVIVGPSSPNGHHSSVAPAPPPPPISSVSPGRSATPTGSAASTSMPPPHQVAADAPAYVKVRQGRRGEFRYF